MSTVPMPHVRDDRPIIAAIVFLLLAGTIVLLSQMVEPSVLLAGVVGSLVSWGTLIVQFYFRKKGPTTDAQPK